MMPKPLDVFLGGACGQTHWREKIAIPLLKEAAVSFYNPQKPMGEWTDADRLSDENAKRSCRVLLFVVTNETRGVASLGEMAYGIGSKRPIALCLSDISPQNTVAGHWLSSHEIEDLNRGRLLIRDLAREHGIAVRSKVEEAVSDCIRLLKALDEKSARIQKILDSIECPGFSFTVDQKSGDFFLAASAEVVDSVSGEKSRMQGRAWPIRDGLDADEIVRTAFFAVRQWQEHEVREFFLYRGERVFGPHIPVDSLARWTKSLSLSQG